MGGKGGPPTMSWEDVDRLPGGGPKLRHPEPAANPFRAGISDPKAFRPMTVEDHLNLAKAPKKARTQVTVGAFDVLANWGVDVPKWARRYTPDHMYVQYDDGRDSYIFRGGPDGPFLSARVDPSGESPDYRKAERVLYRGELPGQSAIGASNLARLEARRLNEGRHPYLVAGSNSNTAVGEVAERQLGRRIGDSQTWGYRGDPAPGGSQIIDALYPLDEVIDVGRGLARRRQDR